MRRLYDVLQVLYPGHISEVEVGLLVTAWEAQVKQSEPRSRLSRKMSSVGNWIALGPKEGPARDFKWIYHAFSLQSTTEWLW